MTPVVWNGPTFDAPPVPRTPPTSRRRTHRERPRPVRLQRARNPKVALVVGRDEPGSTQAAVLNLARGLRRRGYGVLPVLPGEGCGYLARGLGEHGFRIEGIRATGLLAPADVATLTEILRTHRIDVVHAHGWLPAVHATLAGVAAGVPSVITIHDEDSGNGTARRVALRWAAGRSRALVAASRATARALARSLWMSDDYVRVVPNGVAGPRTVRGPTVRFDLGLAPREALILSVGRLHATKGHRTLLGALDLLRRRRPGLPWKALLVGEGEERSSLEGLIVRWGLRDRVFLPGFRADVPDLLDAADLFVLPSVSDTLPLSLLEAMLACRPVVASRVGDLPEVIRDGDTGLLVPPGRSEPLSRVLERVLDDAAFGMKLGEAAHREASVRYTVDAMVDAYEGVYGMGHGGRWSRGGSAVWPAEEEPRPW